MNIIDRILGESKVRPPTEEELTDPHRAYDYAINVIGGRWPEAEETLARTLKDTSGSEWGEEFTDRDAVNELVRTYIKAFPEVSKLEWVMNGWLDWLDL